jgi:hypothetical protein
VKVFDTQKWGIFAVLGVKGGKDKVVSVLTGALCFSCNA